MLNIKNVHGFQWLSTSHVNPLSCRKFLANEAMDKREDYQSSTNVSLTCFADRAVYCDQEASLQNSRKSKKIKTTGFAPENCIQLLNHATPTRKPIILQ